MFLTPRTTLRSLPASVVFVGLLYPPHLYGQDPQATSTPAASDCFNGVKIIDTEVKDITWWRHELPLSIPLMDVSFVDPTEGRLVGGSGLVLHTSNGGKSWTQERTPTRNTLLDLTHDAAGHPWTVGEEGTLLHREDASWNLVSLDTDEDLRAVDFSEMRGLIVGTSGVVLSTTDAGLSWQETFAPRKTHLTSVALDPSGRAWASGEKGTLLLSEDTGATWSPVRLHTKAKLTQVAFFSKERGAVTSEDGEVFETNDLGKTWVKKNTDTPSLFALHFRANGDLWWAGADGWMQSDLTLDHAVRTSTGAAPTLYGLHVLASGSVWVVGEDGYIASREEVTSNRVHRQLQPCD